MVTTKDLPTKELRRRIRSLRNWYVRASQQSIEEYKRELKKRGMKNGKK